MFGHLAHTRHLSIPDGASTCLEELLQHFEQTQPALLLGTLEKADPTGLGRIVRDSQGEFTGIVEHKDASAEELAIREVNMSTYLIDCQHLLSGLQDINQQNSQSEYYITDVPGILIARGEDVRAEPVLQACEALSVNTVDQLQDVEKAMKNMAGHA